MATLVLVHGAFDGGWVWQRVTERLRGRGHVVHTPTLTGSGARHHQLTRETSLATHVTDVVSYLHHEDLRDVVLVGHSYGGTVVTQVADAARDRIRKLVYLDASAPRHGQSASGSFAEGTADMLGKLASATDESWLLPPMPFSAIGIDDPADKAFFDARRHAHPMRTLFEPVSLSAPPPPRAYVRCLRHEGLVAVFGVDPLAPFVDRAREERWEFRELDAGHEVMWTHPEETAALLDALALS